MDFMTAVEVAAALGVSRTTAYKVMREIGRVRVGRVVRVKRDAFEAWIAAHTEPRYPKKQKKPARESAQLTLGFRGER